MRRILGAAGLAVGLVLVGCDGHGVVTAEDAARATAGATDSATVDRPATAGATTGGTAGDTVEAMVGGMVARPAAADATVSGTDGSMAASPAAAGGTARGTVVRPAPPGGQAEAIHARVMAAVPAYLTLNEPKVMVACIDPEPEPPENWRVHQVFTTYTARTSDVPIFLTQLANNALHRCSEWGRAEGIDCNCLPLDKNGRNVLDLS